MKIKRLPGLLSDDECKNLINWVDSLEIGEVAKLKKIYDSKRRPGLLTRFNAWLMRSQLCDLCRKNEAKYLELMTESGIYTCEECEKK